MWPRDGGGSYRLTANRPRFTLGGGRSHRGHPRALLSGMAQIQRRKRSRYGVGVFLALSPIPVGLVLGIFVLVLALSRYVSLSSILATAAFPVLVFFIDHPPWPLLVGASGGAAIVIARHHANIARLLKGTENQAGRRKAATVSSSNK